MLTERHQRAVEAHPHARRARSASLRRREARVAEHARRAARTARARAGALRGRARRGTSGCAASCSRAQGVLAERLVEIYKADQPDCVSVILESDGFNDLLVRADYMSAIGEQDSVIVDRVRELKQQSARKRLLLLDAEAAGRRRPCDVIEAKQRELAGGARRRSRAARASSPRRARNKHGNARRRARAPPRAGGRPARARGGVGAGHGSAAGRRARAGRARSGRAAAATSGR